MKRTWIPGDVYAHGCGVYMYINPHSGGIRLNDGGDRVVAASTPWWDKPNAIFITNIREQLAEMSKDFLKILGERHE